MPQKSAKVEDQTLRSFFGASLNIITLLWNLLVPVLDMNGCHPKHLLWSLLFLKVYSTTAVHCRIVGWVDPKTFRKWSWHFLEKIASLKDDIIQLDNRFANFDGTASCLMSVDGIDCMINEPWPFLFRSGTAINSMDPESNMRWGFASKQALLFGRMDRTKAEWGTLPSSPKNWLDCLLKIKEWRLMLASKGMPRSRTQSLLRLASIESKSQL